MNMIRLIACLCFGVADCISGFKEQLPLSSPHSGLPPAAAAARLPLQAGSFDPTIRHYQDCASVFKAIEQLMGDRELCDAIEKKPFVQKNRAPTNASDLFCANLFRADSQKPLIAQHIFSNLNPLCVKKILFMATKILLSSCSPEEESAAYTMVCFAFLIHAQTKPDFDRSAPVISPDLLQQIPLNKDIHHYKAHTIFYEHTAKILAFLNAYNEMIQGIVALETEAQETTAAVLDEIITKHEIHANDLVLLKSYLPFLEKAFRPTYKVLEVAPHTSGSPTHWEEACVHLFLTEIKSRSFESDPTTPPQAVPDHSGGAGADDAAGHASGDRSSPLRSVSSTPEDARRHERS